MSSPTADHAADPGLAAELDAKIAALTPGVPLALLPVRLETRFVENELRIRVFPDQIHLDAHEPELTDAERAAGAAYWQQRFLEPDPAARDTSPWTALCSVLDPARAAWVVEALTPTNRDRLGQPVAPTFPIIGHRDSEWSVAARATALPQRWLVVGRRSGAEVFRAWSDPVANRLDVTAAPDLEPAVSNDQPALQDTARWMVDFTAAEQAGMALRVPASAVPGGLDAGFDSLVVIGVDWDLTPAAAAGALRTLFSDHAYTDGLSAVAAGTPTNITSTARPGSPPGISALVAAFDPEDRPAPEVVAGGGLDRLWRGLGLEPSPVDLLTAVPGADDRAQETALWLADALWESTLGGFLADMVSPVVPDAQAEVLREHVRRHLLPAGPFPALRIARQPYGVLPVVAATYRPDPVDPVEGGLVGVLTKLRIFWQRTVPVVPRLGRTDDLDADLNELLQTTPLTSSVRFRTVLGPLTVSSTVGLDRHAVAQQYITSMLGVHLGVPPPTAWNEFALHPGHQRFDRPLVGDATAGRLADIARLVRTAGTFAALQAREAESTSLLEALALYAAERELHRADLRTINDFRVSSGQIAALPAVGVLPMAEYVGIEAATATPAGSVQVSTPSDASRVVIAAVTGRRTVRQHVTARLGQSVPPPELATLARTVSGLAALEDRSAPELDRALRGLLDAYGYRLDAWYTSLAHRRLERLRQSTPTGVHLGAYGWLDDVRPAVGAPVNDGFIHAPSLAHAATSAVLRSGHLAHHDAEHQALQIDLSADRVRTALALVEGVAQGQPLAALLGYRFERAVRDRGLELAQYILPIRRLVPLRPDGAAADAPTLSDQVAARDVVDGVGLLERWRTEGRALFDALQALVTFPPPPAEVFVMPPQSIRDELAVELDRLADSYDAVADVLLAESVHQNVLGNRERSAAAVTALDRQGRPPRLDFVRTPRSGLTYTQRVLVLIGDETFPPTWPAPVLDPRGAAEPRLSAWLARIIGDPGRVRFAATVQGTAAGSTVELVVTLAELGLSPLAAVLASEAPGSETSELEDRLRLAFATRIPVGADPSSITLLDGRPRAGNDAVWGLGAFRALAHRAYALITTHRPATAADLAPPDQQVADQPDSAGLSARASTVAGAYAMARATVESAMAAATPSEPDLRSALAAAADLGVDAAVPPPISTVADLVNRLRAVATVMAQASDRAAELSDPTARIRALLGAQFPVLPRFSVTDPASLTASRSARSTLCGGDDLAPGGWLQQLALVRAGVARFAQVRGAAELLHSTDVVPRGLAVLQLPHVAGDRWLALPFDAVPAGRLAIVAEQSGTVDFAAPLAGLFVDAWTETIPGPEETTGVAFHHDAPGARAPQTILLAVPPDPADPSWSTEIVLDTLTEAQALARIRGVAPDRLEWLGTLLPAIVLPDPASVQSPAVPLKRLANTDGVG